MELRKIKDGIYYISNVVNIGCIVKDGETVLIDTGLEDATAKKIINLLKGEGLEIKAIINTHSHADHFGGNAYIQQKTGAKVYAPFLEEAAITYPYFEPLYLFSGAHPLKELQNKFLMGKPSKVDGVIHQHQESLELLGLSLKIVPLPGHSMNQIGIEIDDVLFCGDVFVTPELLEKHKIPFNMHICKQKETLEWLKETQYDWYVPSHSEPIRQVKEMAEKNLEVLKDIDGEIVRILSEKKTSGELVKALCDVYGIQCSNLGQYYLFYTTIMAHVSGLADFKKIQGMVEENQVYWVSK